MILHGPCNCEKSFSINSKAPPHLEYSNFVLYIFFPCPTIPNPLPSMYELQEPRPRPKSFRGRAVYIRIASDSILFAADSTE